MSDTDEFLEHYGVMGMHWGQRKTTRSERKVIRKDYAALTRKLNVEEYERVRPRIEELEKQARSLSNRYDFDGDDGGGGSTKSAEKAGASYMKKWEQASDLEYKVAPDRARKRAQDMIVKKYGKEKYDDIFNHKQMDSKDVDKMMTIGIVSVGAIAILGISKFVPKNPF